MKQYRVIAHLLSGKELQSKVVELTEEEHTLQVKAYANFYQVNNSVALYGDNSDYFIPKGQIEYLEMRRENPDNSRTP